jgi:rhomboid family GlyGly-CTERM serine protease
MRRWSAVIAVAVVCIGLSVGGDTVRDALRYERIGLIGGEWWRLLGAHFVHLGWGHAALNVVALCIVAALLEGVLDTVDWIVIVVAAAAGIDAGLFWFAPEVEWYVGLSGVLHGITAAGAVRLAARRDPVGLALVVLLVAKLIWEHFVGALPGSETTSGGSVITEAHLYGALGGLIGLWLAKLVPRKRVASL